MVFVGSVSAGKSTFINALLGKNLLPSATEATTAAFVEIREGELAVLATEEHGDTGALGRRDRGELRAAGAHLERAEGSGEQHAHPDPGDVKGARRAADPDEEPGAVRAHARAVGAGVQAAHHPGAGLIAAVSRVTGRRPRARR